MPRDSLGRDPLDAIDDDAVVDLLPPRRRRGSGKGRRRRSGPTQEVAGEGRVATVAEAAEAVEPPAAEPPADGPGVARPALSGRAKLTAELPAPLLERARDAAYWTPGLTLAGLVADALRRELARREDERGDGYERRPGELPTGRPVR